MNARAILGWIGEVVMNATLAATASVVSGLLMKSVCHVRPTLNESQRRVLRAHFEATLTMFFEGRRNISGEVRGMISIICHDMTEENREELYQQFVQILRMFDLHGFLADEPIAIIYNDYDGGDDIDHERDYHMLVSRLGLSPDRVKSIPRCVRAALVSELMKSPPPICSITLERVTNRQGTIRKGIVALVRKIPTSSWAYRRRDRIHAFLYRSEALDRWFEIGGEVNPLTRERVHRSSQLFQLS